MKSIIKDIFYGKCINAERLTPSKEYNDILCKISEVYNEIESKLSVEIKEIFQEYCNLQAGLEVEASDAHFVEGVKLGILIGIEACN